MNTPLPSTFVSTVDIGIAPKMLADLKEQNFEITTPPHTIFCAKKKGVSCTLYTSGKLTVQGKEKGPFIEFYLEPEILKTFTYTHPANHQEDTHDTSERIGIDESGKGDFFGPLCIAGVFAGGETLQRLRDLGVRDSKDLSDKAITAIAQKLRHECVHHIVKINPSKYNELLPQFGNLNKLLAWGHATTIEALYEKTGCHSVIIDQFADEHVVLTALKRKKLNLDLTQRHRGEEDLVVAAASILARWAFITGVAQLEQEFKQSFPKGASKKTIEAGREFVRTYGRDKIGLVGKVHFKTLDSILPTT